MIEKLLRRFVSEDTEYVLSAMEHVGSDPEQIDHYRLISNYDSMYNAQYRVGGVLDRTVLYHVRRRLEEERERKSRTARARLIASKILVGETFEDGEDEPSIVPGQYIQVGNAATNQVAGMVGQATSAVSTATIVRGYW